jgi:hypothetical protein
MIRREASMPSTLGDRLRIARARTRECQESTPERRERGLGIPRRDPIRDHHALGAEARARGLAELASLRDAHQQLLT